MTSAQAVLDTFKLEDRIYAIGVRERRVTLYSQQVRALNLVWALTELEAAGEISFQRVAIVGGGAAGLTAAAALLSLQTGKKDIWLFERQWDFCPLQQGCDGRWLHPKIYHWPDRGSRAPSAGLPVLNWSEGRASDVARSLLEGFSTYRLEARARHDLKAFVGVNYLKVDPSESTITWMGTNVEFGESPYLNRGRSEGGTAEFDLIVIAAGYGFERGHRRFNTPSYWHNDQYAQLHRDGGRKQYVVSGFGDGALVDVCRLAIDRFRQDTIVYELFGSSPEAFEATIRGRLGDGDRNLFKFFEENYEELLSGPKKLLQPRLRKDTSVMINVKGTKKAEAAPEEERQRKNGLETIFEPQSSVLNRLLVYLLFKCGRISVDNGEVSTKIRERGVAVENVIIRHGCDTETHLASIFQEMTVIGKSFERMYDDQAQTPKPFWTPGFYPVLQPA